MKTSTQNILGKITIFIFPCSTMTMEELLASLTKKAKLECEEEHRQVVASMNGLSGLHIIRNQVHIHVQLLPLAPEVWGKVMLLHLPVCPPGGGVLLGGYLLFSSCWGEGIPKPRDPTPYLPDQTRTLAK